MLPPTGARASAPDDMMYPAPNIKWYPNAEDHPSLFAGREEHGLKAPEVKVVQRPTSSPSAGSNRRGGTLLVNVVEAFELPASQHEEGPGSYRLTAYYQSEMNQSVVEKRKSAAVVAVPNPKRKAKEDCTFNVQLRMPFDSLEQFVKVAIFRVDRPTDSLVGEATLTLADPAVEDLADHFLMRDLEDMGGVVASARLPRDDDPPEDAEEPPSGTQPNSPQSPGAPSPPFSGTTDPGVAPEVAPAQPSGIARGAVGPSPDTATPDGRFRIGQDVEIFSKSAGAGGAWVPARITRIEGPSVTVDYGPRRRVLNVGGEEAVDLRHPEAGNAPLGSIASSEDFVPARPEPPFGSAVASEAPAPGSGIREGSESSSSEEEGSSEEEAQAAAPAAPAPIIAPPRYVGTVQYSPGAPASQYVAPPRYVGMGAQPAAYGAPASSLYQVGGAAPAAYMQGQHVTYVGGAGGYSATPGGAVSYMSGYSTAPQMMQSGLTMPHGAPAPGHLGAPGGATYAQAMPTYYAAGTPAAHAQHQPQQYRGSG